MRACTDILIVKRNTDYETIEKKFVTVKYVNKMTTLNNWRVSGLDGKEDSGPERRRFKTNLFNKKPLQRRETKNTPTWS